MAKNGSLEDAKNASPDSNRRADKESVVASKPDHHFYREVIMSSARRTVKDPRSAVTALLACLSVAMLSYSCSSQVEFSRHQQSSNSATIPPTAASSSSPMGSGVGINGQTVSHYDEQNRIAEAFLPNGSLAVGQQVTMSSSYHTDPSDLIDEFGIKKGGTIKETQVATVITSNMNENLKQPMTVALDLPPSAGLLGLIWQSRNYFIVYTVHDSTTNQWRRGIMPDAALTVRKGRVLFQSQFLGRFEIFESVDPIEYGIKEKPAPKPDFSNPPIAIHGITPLVARKGETITIDGKYFTKDTTVTIAGAPAAQTFVKPQEILVYLPASTSFGPATVVLKDGSNQASYEIIAHTKADAATVPYAAGDRNDICSSVTFYTPAGSKDTGTKACDLSACSAEGETNCTATASFPAQNPADMPWDKIFVNHRGILGNQGTMAVPAQKRICGSNGAKDCRIQGSFIALAKGALTSAVLKKGVTIPAGGEIAADIVGSFPSVSSPLPGFDGMQHPLTEGGFNAALTNPVSHQFWDRFGNRQIYTGTTDLVPEAIKQGVEIYGVVGKIPDNKTACDKSGKDDCQVTGTYVAETRALIAEANFKNGHTVGTVTGSYPSATQPLGTVPAGPTEITSAASFNGAMTSAADFTYFDSKGQRLTAQGSASIKPENIVKGKTVFGVAGSFVADSTNTLAAADIRAGVTIAGTVGELRTNCRNMAQTALIENEGVHATAGLDPLDNVIDAVTPSQNPWGKAEFACTKEQWQKRSSDPLCNADVSKCAFKDKSTGYTWGGFSATKRKWDQAGSYCQGLNLDGKSTGWTLPSQSELYEASAHGIQYNRDHQPQFFSLAISDLYLWSKDAATSGKKILQGHFGYGLFRPDSESHYVICVHKN